MTQRAPVPPLARAVFLASAIGAGMVVLLGHAAVPGPDAWGWWLVTLAVPLLYRFPLTISRGPRTIEVGFESVVVIFLAFTVPDYALILWTGGWLLAQVPLPGGLSVRRTSPWISLYNIAMTTLGGAAVVIVITRLVPGALDPGPGAVIAVLLAAGAFFLVDYVMSAIAQPLLGRATLREAWLYDDFAVALASTMGVGVLGFLGSVALRADPWAMPLIAIPVATFVSASRAFARASAERGRVEALLQVASRLHQATSVDDITAVVKDHGPAALRTEELRVASELPASGISASVTGASGERWLEAVTRRNHQPYNRGDRQTLDLVASLASDALARVALHAELEVLAARDPLTGLANRATLQRVMQDELSQRDVQSTAVLFCDLDGFKAVNDRYGHDVGDQVLCRVGERLQRCVRDGDLIARMGGDEFVALLPGAGERTAFGIAERIRKALSDPDLVPVGEAAISVSIGVAVVGPGQSAHVLLTQADTAMYRAKSAGKNQVWISDGRTVMAGAR